MTRRAPASASALARLPGLGPASTALLARAGVHDAATLRASDPVALYLRLRALDARTSLNMLYALVGAREGIDWRVVARDRRTDLLTELDARQRVAPAAPKRKSP
jgi:DNA transformation protein and related proteins